NARLAAPGTRYCFRVGADGQLSVDIVVKFVQQRLGGSRPQYRGTTLVASADGIVRYAIHNQRIPRFEKPNEAVALREPSQPKSIKQAPFPSRYRLTHSKYRSLSPGLAPTRKELAQLQELLNFGQIS